MKRTLVVLALAAFSAAGCRAVAPHGQSDCGEPCHVATSQMAPRPGQSFDNYGHGHSGNFAETVASCDACQGGNGECFGRYCNSPGGGYGPGPYDCSACNSPNWGCNGHAHGQGLCARCGQPGAGCCCASGDHRYQFAPGPPVGQTAYPYYTVRGPRDFLDGNPSPLGN